MFKFEKPGYGDWYIVLAETTQEALDKLKGHMLSHLHGYEEEYPKWKEVTLNSLPDGFTISCDDCDVIEANWH